ncbi:DUF2514 family protein [Metapseudomonas sp. CR1201]
MQNRQGTLSRLQSIASITSAIAIPVVIAVVGYFVQRQIADDGIQKDYVSIAAEVLRANPSKQDPALREWAATVLTKYSPVSFSPEAKDGLARGLYASPAMPELPAVARQEDLTTLCAPSCADSLTAELKDWHRQLGATREDDARDVLSKLLNQSTDRNLALAAALDRSRISGQACERIYDKVRGEE